MQSEARKFRFINTFFVLILMLVSIALTPTQVQAQAETSSVYLPLLVDGSAPRIQAAVSCYSSQNAFVAALTHRGGSTYSTEKIKVKKDGSRCNDLNIYTKSWTPVTGCIQYVVRVFNENDKLIRDSGAQWVCRYPERWKVLTYGLVDEYSYQVFFVSPDRSPRRVILAD